MTPEHYEDVVYERSAAHICGWPLCDHPVSATSVSSQYKVDRRLGAIVNANTARDYHASGCLMNSKLYAQQLSTEPVYLRTKFTPPVIDQFDEHVTQPPITDMSSNTPNLVIKERDTESDVVELPNIESTQTLAIEGYVHTKNSNSSNDLVSSPSFSEKQQINVKTESQSRSDVDVHSDSDESDVEDVEDLFGNFFISSKKIPIPELSIFGSMWTTLSRWITPETHQWLRGKSPEVSQMTDVTDVTDVNEDDSAVRSMPAIDSEAPELIRRNTVKHMLFK